MEDLVYWPIWLVVVDVLIHVAEMSNDIAHLEVGISDATNHGREQHPVVLALFVLFFSDFNTFLELTLQDIRGLEQKSLSSIHHWIVCGDDTGVEVAEPLSSPSRDSRVMSDEVEHSHCGR